MKIVTKEVFDAEINKYPNLERVKEYFHGAYTIYYWKDKGNGENRSNGKGAFASHTKSTLSDNEEYVLYE